MSVRAKFRVDSIERTGYTSGYEKLPDGITEDYSKPIKTELHTVKLNPVYGNGNPEHENTKFWKASPSGSFTLGTVNPEAAKQFILGEEYYIDITPASK